MLQEVGSWSSGFNVVSVEQATHTHKQFVLRWKKDRYVLHKTIGPKRFVRDHLRTTHDFEVNDEFRVLLDDPGRGFTHPERKELRLSDLYVYPDLWRRSFRGQMAASRGKSVTIPSARVVDAVADFRRLLVTGEPESGKTSFAKTLFGVFSEKFHFVPIMISGEEIDGPTEEALSSAARHAFGREYDPLDWERFQHLESHRRAIIIVNFQRFRFNSRGQREILAAAERSFGRVIVLADDVFRFAELLNRGDANPFFEYEHCEIQPFGYLLRRRLVTKWVSLGREYTLDDKALDEEIRSREDVVNALIGKNLLPAFPVNVLIMLQTLQAGQNHALVGGAYGYYYEALITPALAASGSQVSDTDTKYTFLARFAYFLFTNDVAHLSEDELRGFTNSYLKSIRLDLEPITLIDELLAVQVFERRAGAIGFRYRYYYFYFVARHLKNLALVASEREDVVRQLHELVDFIYYEPYSNILVFYLYFNLDTDLIEYLLDKADTIFHEHQLSELEDDVDFFNRLREERQARRLLPSDPAANQERMLADMDRADSTEPEEAFKPKPERIAYADHLHPVYKLNIGLRTIQVLGQVLRNFPGSIEGDLKSRIASTCYQLGLRTLRSVLASVEGAYPGLKEYLGRLVEDRKLLDRQNGDSQPLPKDAEQFTLWLAEACGLGMIKRISKAVGHQQLGPIYRDVLQQAPDYPSYALIDISIKLDDLSRNGPPVKEIKDLVGRFDNNPLARSILRDLVYQHLCLFWHDFDTKQRLADSVGIEVENAKMLNAGRKLLGGKRGPKS